VHFETGRIRSAGLSHTESRQMAFKALTAAYTPRSIRTVVLTLAIGSRRQSRSRTLGGDRRRGVGLRFIRKEYSNDSTQDENIGGWWRPAGDSAGQGIIEVCRWTDDQPIFRELIASGRTTMLGPKVLDSENFREIRFHSTEVNRHSNNQWTVHGDLTVHGQTRPVQAEVERQNGGYRGSAELRHKNFGITPVSVAGGSVKVKDEVRIEFEIVGK
jgi:hypothetical protein